MLNDPPPERRKQHPLERDPVTPPSPEPSGGQPPRPQVILHIPSVRPMVTYAIIILNVIVFVIRATSPQLDDQFLVWGANHGPDVVANGEVYRLLTSMFLHASIYDFRGDFALQNSLHIIFNMYILYVMGTQVERLFGHVRFAAVYLLGGLAGSVLSAVLGSDNSYSVGASGAVFAVIGAQFIYLYQHRKLLGARGRAQMRSLLYLAVINLFFGALTSVAGAGIRVDNWAHLGGLFGGSVLAFAIGPIYIVRRHPEHPNELLGDDINPLRNRYWVLSVYVIALMVILIAARSFA